MGWYTEKDGGIPLIAEPTITDDMTFYAKWKKVNQEDNVNNDEEIKSPQTFDDFKYYMLTLVISFIGIVGTTLYLKKKEN